MSYQVLAFNKETQEWRAYPECFNHSGPWSKAVSYCSILNRGMITTRLKLKWTNWKPKPYDKAKDAAIKAEYDEWFEYHKNEYRKSKDKDNE